MWFQSNVNMAGRNVACFMIGRTNGALGGYGYPLVIRQSGIYQLDDANHIINISVRGRFAYLNRRFQFERANVRGAGIIRSSYNRMLPKQIFYAL